MREPLQPEATRRSSLEVPAGTPVLATAMPLTPAAAESMHKLQAATAVIAAERVQARQLVPEAATAVAHQAAVLEVVAAVHQAAVPEVVAALAHHLEAIAAAVAAAVVT